MGLLFTRHSLPLASFHRLFKKTHWERVLPNDSYLSAKGDSSPEACYRLCINGECYEISYHEPIDQVALSVRSKSKNQRYNLFFFLENDGRALIKTIQRLVYHAAIDLLTINNVLIETNPSCHFTLLELPGEGLFEVGPRKAQA